MSHFFFFVSELNKCVPGTQQVSIHVWQYKQNSMKKPNIQSDYSLGRCCDLNHQGVLPHIYYVTKSYMLRETFLYARFKKASIINDDF